MRLSIIIPMYNVENFIGRCLDSLFDQDISLEDYEIILINDGSTDNTLIAIKKYTKKYKNITLISQENKGQSVARNLGISKAKGDHILFIDSDDYIANNVLKILLETLNRNKLDILRFNLVKTNRTDLVVCRNITTVNSNIKVFNGLEFIAYHDYHDSACTFIINRFFLNQTGINFINGRIMEDAIFTAELILKSNRIGFLPLDIYRYRFNPHSTYNSAEKNHNSKAATDFEFMVYKFQELILTIDPDKNRQTIKILNHHKEQLLISVFKRILQSNLSVSEIIETYRRLKKNHLIPIHFSKANDIKTYFIKSINYPTIFIFEVLLFRLFSSQVNQFINSSYRKSNMQKNEVL